MENFTNYNFGLTKVTAIVRDGSYLWIAFLGVSGISKLRKVSASNLNQIYYEVLVPVDKITRMVIASGYLYAIADDATYSVVKYNTTNPLGSYTLKEVLALGEFPIDLKIDGSYLYMLYPGEAGGTNSVILKRSTSALALVTQIDLLKSGEIINNATSMAIDGNSNIWVTTFDNPALLVKVYDLGGGVYDFVSYNIG